MYKAYNVLHPSLGGGPNMLIPFPSNPVTRFKQKVCFWQMIKTQLGLHTNISIRLKTGFWINFPGVLTTDTNLNAWWAGEMRWDSARPVFRWRVWWRSGKLVHVLYASQTNWKFRQTLQDQIHETSHLHPQQDHIPPSSLNGSDKRRWQTYPLSAVKVAHYKTRSATGQQLHPICKQYSRERKQYS